ncbi:MAG: metal ABC transporter permease [Solirubrobacterales bacterium]
MIDWVTEPLSYGTTLRALVEITVLGVVSGAIGCWIVLYELSYSAESLAHGLFPGLVIAALIGAPLLLGGAIGVLLAALLVVLASRLADESADTAIAVVITTLFGAGVLLALSPSSPPGIQELLFGDLLGASTTDILLAAGVGTAVLAVLWVLHDRLLAIGFDSDSGPALGISVGSLNVILLALVSLTILVSVQGLGNLLVAAILVGPAAAARLVTRQIRPMMAIAALIAVVAGFCGIYASFYLGTAAGASVVIALVACYLAAAATSALQGRLGRRPEAG